MKIDLERFLALTATLAAPLVTASGCIITGTDDDDDGAQGTDDGASADDATDPSGSPTSGDDAPGTDDAAGTDTGTDGGTDTGTGGTGTDDAADTTAADTTGGDPLGNCCEAHDGTGCEVTEVSDCVCSEDPFCCESAWDMNCVSEVNAFGCGACELPPQVWDCYCLADCDGTAVETPWQVCSGDEIDAAAMGTAACEADLGANCDTFVCDECGCFTAEVPTIECPA
jgi:hypothetical protein